MVYNSFVVYQCVCVCVFFSAHIVKQHINIDLHKNKLGDVLNYIFGIINSREGKKIGYVRIPTLTPNY